MWPCWNPLSGRLHELRPYPTEHINTCNFVLWTLGAGGSDITESGTTFSLEPEVTQVVAGGTSTTKLGSVIEPFVSAPPQYTGCAVNGVDLGGLRNV
jgi:hypothetical protein